MKEKVEIISKKIIKRGLLTATAIALLTCSDRESTSTLTITQRLVGQEPETPKTIFLPIAPEIHPAWSEFDLPISVNIPQIDFFDMIQLADSKPGKKENHLTYITPETGIATPRHPLKNSIFIFGHSRKDKKDLLPIHNIQNLEKGHIFAVQNQKTELFFFMVKNFKLVNLAEPNAVLNSYNEPTVVLQTTAKDSVKPNDWILDEDLILSKVGNNLPNDINGVSLVFQVEAVQVEIRGLP
ncbi:MAG TPA: hypothetical protein VIK81_05190 [Patescibacteria group bacterium]